MKKKLEEISEYSFDDKTANDDVNDDKSDLEKEIEKEMAIETEREKRMNGFKSIESKKNMNNNAYTDYNINENNSEDIVANINNNKISNIKMKKSVIRFGRKETSGFWKKKRIGTSDWLTFSPNENWLWWVIGGYTVSVLLFRITDWINGSIIPADWFEIGNGHIVSQMVAPEGNDVIALLLGAIAPCLSAPLWEEIFYR